MKRVNFSCVIKRVGFTEAFIEQFAQLFRPLNATKTSAQKDILYFIFGHLLQVQNYFLNEIRTTKYYSKFQILYKKIQIPRNRLDIKYAH